MTPLSVFMFSVSFDHQEHLRQRLSQASRSIKRILTPPRRGSGDQGESSVHRRRHVIHQDSEVQENQESEAAIIESVQENSDSVAHDQQHPPPQNQEYDESVEIMVQLMLQSISVIELIVMEKKARSRKESGES